MTTYQSFLYGTTLYGGPGALTSAPSTDLVVFEGFSLADNTSMVATLLIDSAPSRELVSGRLPRVDGEYVNADYWREKLIEVRGWVRKTSINDLEAYLDTIRKNLRKREGNLDITKLDGEVRRYKATLINGESLFADRRGHNVTVCPFTAIFSCKTPFASDREYTSDSLSVGSNPTNRDVQNFGTIEAEPIVWLIVDSASALTSVTVKNITNGEEITITPSGGFSIGDVLKIDCEAKEVLLNGTSEDFSGSFPQLDVGGNTLEFSFTATSASFTATIQHVNRYL